ncbi:maleylacetate reductase [Vibrio splendidus]|nr:MULTISPECIES: maleylacetate reductase [Vibrio]CAH7065062.1 Maleylacetate reductase [Vibrio chagasii]MDH5923145.1 maleylacetate reductase [Vibrio splendidus]MDH5951623.1 maleylacetate reductase [Vibrio crassostreae]ROO49603.1 maleylacetate reductase [Vibrio crassostreae]TCN04681.1 maleylacetate reductase [Vibrio crassostreae]
MSDSFIYNGLPTRVIFGSGIIDQVAAEAEYLGITKALVISTPHQVGLAEKVAKLLGDKSADVFAGAAMHTPVDVTEKALSICEALAVDGLVSVGGGSTTGLGKALAYRKDYPQLVLPTSYAGSEMTNILGQTKQGLKTTVRDASIQPETVLYDVDLTLTMPALFSGTSGINAIAHAVEALYAVDGNPIISLIAEEGIRSLYKALPILAKHSTDLEARKEALYGAWLCGICLGSVGVAIHHKLCHALGGAFDLPHAKTHTVVLPHALAYNAPAVPDAMKRLCRAMDTDNPVAALFDLARVIGAPHSLEALGMPEDGIDKAVEITFKNPYWNPKELDREAIKSTIHSAWKGIRPELQDVVDE